jgi:hypothetical protein
MPKVITRSSAVEGDGEPLRRIDLGAMNALQSQAIGELLARCNALEARIAQLEAP